MAVVMNKGVLPRHNWLIWVCIAYLAFAFMEASPWAAWGLPRIEVMHLPDWWLTKTYLSPLRFVHVAALIYVVITSSRMEAWLTSKLLQPVLNAGKHSLEVFSFGFVLSESAGLVLATFPNEALLQIVVSVAGIAAMLALGWMLERRKNADRRKDASSYANSQTVCQAAGALQA